MLLFMGCWLLVSGCLLLVTGYWLLVAGYWLLVTGYRLLITVYLFHVQSSKSCYCHCHCLLPLLTATAYCNCLLPLLTATAYCNCLLLLPTAAAYCHSSPGHTSPVIRLSGFYPEHGNIIPLPVQGRWTTWRAFAATHDIGWPSATQQALFVVRHFICLFFIHLFLYPLFQYSWRQMVNHQFHNEPLVSIIC
jgi:hypothetical protein